MPKIGLNEIAAAYALSKEVEKGTLTEREAGLKLHASYGMNYSSAMGYLRKRSQLITGQRYTRTMNIEATRYFLDHIHRDEGGSGLRKALQSVKKHAEYYQEQGKSGLPSIMKLIEDFEQLIALDDLGEVDKRFQHNVELSKKLTVNQRKAKLPKKDTSRLKWKFRRPFLFVIHMS